MQNLLQLLHETGERRAVKIVHHVRGRIRLRATLKLGRLLSGKDKKELLARVASTIGIDDIRVNPANASIVIQYNNKVIPVETWEMLFQGSDEESLAASKIFIPKRDIASIENSS